ncbi:MAG: hypothetical protein MR738_01225 [Enterocloster clostridioformis]|nr:hypothetical protein [Enterocloster clostridioformis]DAJ99586.1 MAG TPA: hypothetical protein [Caudoviricetes sp.]
MYSVYEENCNFIIRGEGVKDKKEVKYMSSESLKESVIVGIVKKMKQMDMSTLIIVKAATDALEAKERLDREAKREEKEPRSA